MRVQATVVQQTQNTKFSCEVNVELKRFETCRVYVTKTNS